MKCVKCGRDTDQTFCESCRDDMARYPVKPGTIVQLPKAIDLYLLPDHKLPIRGMIALDRMFGRMMKPIAGKNGFRFVLQDRYRQNVTNFVTRLLMAAAGEEQSAAAGSQ